mgnify:CR=1 FL=1
MEKAQALGLKFCEENFSGHPAIVCTHPDGHNHSGNIHVHIVIGSVRMREGWNVSPICKSPVTGVRV